MLVATDQALGDEVAAAAGMLMGKASGRPAVLVRGLATAPAPGRPGAAVDGQAGMDSLPRWKPKKSAAR